MALSRVLCAVGVRLCGCSSDGSPPFVSLHISTLLPTIGTAWRKSKPLASIFLLGGWSVRCSRKVATDNRSILPPCWRSKRCSRRWRTNGSARPLAAHLNALDPCRLRRLPCRKFAGTAFNFAYIAGRMAVKGLINLDVIVLPCHVLEGGLALPQQPFAAHLCHPCPAGMSVPWTADTHATA